MKSGLKIIQKDRRDLDYFATKGFAKLAGVTTLPLQYSVDAGLRIPNQEAEDDNFTPSVPPLPFGCTDYAQSELLADEDGKLYNPMDIENITHASANGGGDIRAALKAVTKLHPDHPKYFNINPSMGMDYFDAARLAMLIAATEKRGVSVGSPFWHQWNAVGPNGILPAPDYDITEATAHNWVIKGWDTIAGATYLTAQMLQGKEFGNKGFVYVPREQFNATMAVSWATMFTLDKITNDEQIKTVGSPIIQEIVDFIRSLFSHA